MRKILFGAITSLMFSGAAVAQEKIVISSPWGTLTAELADNEATRALLEMLPISLDMQDHLRQEKTGNLPSSLPQGKRQLNFCR